MTKRGARELPRSSVFATENRLSYFHPPHIHAPGDTLSSHTRSRFRHRRRRRGRCQGRRCRQRPAYLVRHRPVESREQVRAEARCRPCPLEFRIQGACFGGQGTMGLGMGAYCGVRIRRDGWFWRRGAWQNVQRIPSRSTAKSYSPPVCNTYFSVAIRIFAYRRLRKFWTPSCSLSLF